MGARREMCPRWLIRVMVWFGRFDMVVVILYLRYTIGGDGFGMVYVDFVRVFFKEKTLDCLDLLIIKHKWCLFVYFYGVFYG